MFRTPICCINGLQAKVLGLDSNIMENNIMSLAQPPNF